MLSIFDCSKARKYTQGLYLTMSANCKKKSAGIIYQKVCLLRVCRQIHSQIHRFCSGNRFYRENRVIDFIVGIGFVVGTWSSLLTIFPQNAICYQIKYEKHLLQLNVEIIYLYKLYKIYKDTRIM